MHSNTRQRVREGLGGGGGNLRFPPPTNVVYSVLVNDYKNRLLFNIDKREKIFMMKIFSNNFFPHLHWKDLSTHTSLQTQKSS